jgi:(2S)-methylsuccinyl-CoA dehydrogenase
VVQGIVAKIRVEFSRIVGELAARCETGGRIDPALADEHQFACFELAWAHAELLAAKTMLEDLEAMGPVDQGLSVAFCCETALQSLSRLEGVSLSLGQDVAKLHALRCSPEMIGLRKTAAAPDAMARLGQLVIEGDRAPGHIDLDEETSIAAETFARFAAEVVAPVAEEIHRKDLTVPESLLQPMREMGVFGLSIPEQYGGYAGNRENTALMIAVTEALSEASLAAAGSLITRPEILARALLAGGTEAQKQNWLPRIAAGDPLVAISITEPDFGSDVAALSMRATPTQGGWLLNGAKTWCTFAGKAGVIMVVARTDPDRSLGHRGLSLLLVEKPSYEDHEFAYEQPGGGKLTGRAIPTIGYRGMHSFDLSFEQFLVPDSNVVGEAAGLGKGFYLTMAGMTGGRIQTSGRALGVMRASLKAAIAYARDRKVFGQALADFQLTRVRIAQMAARLVACRHLAFAVGKRLDQGEGSAEASLVKLLACRSAEMVSREALQIHGGMGYAEEMPISRYWIDARVLSIFEGAEETLALKVIARGLLDDALRCRQPA